MTWSLLGEEMKWKMFIAADSRLHTVCKDNARANTASSHLQPNVTKWKEADWESDGLFFINQQPRVVIDTGVHITNHTCTHGKFSYVGLTVFVRTFFFLIPPQVEVSIQYTWMWKYFSFHKFNCWTLDALSQPSHLPSAHRFQLHSKFCVSECEPEASHFYICTLYTPRVLDKDWLPNYWICDVKHCLQALCTYIILQRGAHSVRLTVGKQAADSLFGWRGTFIYGTHLFISTSEVCLQAS